MRKTVKLAKENFERAGFVVEKKDGKYYEESDFVVKEIKIKVLGGKMAKQYENWKVTGIIKGDKIVFRLSDFIGMLKEIK